MADPFNLFGASVTPKGVFTVKDVTLTFKDSDEKIVASGCLAQSVSYSFSRRVGAVQDLGSGDIYVIASRPTGQVTITGLVITRSDYENLLEAFGDSCSYGYIEMKFSSPCGQSTGDWVQRFVGCALVSQGGETSSEQPAAVVSLAFMFYGLEIESSAS